MGNTDIARIGHALRHYNSPECDTGKNIRQQPLALGRADRAQNATILSLLLKLSGGLAEMGT